MPPWAAVRTNVPAADRRQAERKQMETTLSKLGGSGACHENRKGAALYGKKTEKMLRSRLFKNAIIAL